jgi:hypothetical protein
MMPAFRPVFCPMIHFHLTGFQGGENIPQELGRRPAAGHKQAGGRGHLGSDAKGRTYIAAFIPGTGLYNRAYYGASKPIAQNTVPLTGVPLQPAAGNGLKLFIAFMAGGVVFSIVGARMYNPPASPPVLLPAAVITPVVPPPVAPAKRRGHGAKRASAQELPHPSAPTKARNTQQPPPHSAFDAGPPAS